MFLLFVFWLSGMSTLAQDSTTAKPSGDKTPTFGPADLFQSFPKIELGMKFPEVKKAVEKQERILLLQEIAPNSPGTTVSTA